MKGTYALDKVLSPSEISETPLIPISAKSSTGFGSQKSDDLSSGLGINGWYCMASNPSCGKFNSKYTLNSQAETAYDYYRKSMTELGINLDYGEVKKAIKKKGSNIYELLIRRPCTRTVFANTVKLELISLLEVKGLVVSIPLCVELRTSAFPLCAAIVNCPELSSVIEAVIFLCKSSFILQQFLFYLFHFFDVVLHQWFSLCTIFDWL